jgi:hypothetical protein
MTEIASDLVILERRSLSSMHLGAGREHDENAKNVSARATSQCRPVRPMVR